MTKMNIISFILGLVLIILTLAIVIEGYVENKVNKDRYEKSFSILDRPLEIQIENVETGKEIPKNILQTHKSREIVPKYVFDNIKKGNEDWNYHFLDDQECKKFLYDYYGQQVLDKFNSFKLGAHKSDLFRVCWLYQFGGVYVDIDTELKKSMDSIVSNIEDFTIMLCDFRKNIYNDIISRTMNVEHKTLVNSFIVCKKGDPRIKKCIESIMKINQSDLENNYALILFVMQKTLDNQIEYQVFEKIDNILIPFRGGRGIMYDKNNNMIGYSKYAEYKNGFREKK